MKPEPHAIRVTIGPFPGPEAVSLPGSDLPAEPAELRTPLIDIHEGPEGLVLEADLPGVTDRAISIQLQDNVLTMQASVEAALPAGAKPLYLEFVPTPYARSFILSDEVDRAQISAELRQGVLHVNLPRAERSRTRRIEVKGS